MPSWVIRKTLPTHDHGVGQSRSRGEAPSPHFLYWAGPHIPYPRTASWVWLTGLCPQVARYPTQADAEAAAQAFSSTWKRTLSIRAVTIEAPTPPR